MTAADPKALLELARAGAETGGALLLARFDAGTERALGSKSTPTDLVSEADLASQRAIRELLSRERPADAFIGEEDVDEAGSSGVRWVVDPLDGTVNFLFALPQWCVSVAAEDADGTICGVIYDPLRAELFCACRDRAPTLNGRPIAASTTGDLAGAMIATGFSYDANVRAEQGPIVARLIGRVRDLRRFGSAALDLAWTAAGRYDGYFERAVKPWDIAAGVLLCQGAGLAVRDMPATPTLPYGIIAAAPGIADALEALVVD